MVAMDTFVGKPIPMFRFRGQIFRGKKRPTESLFLWSWRDLFPLRMPWGSQSPSGPPAPAVRVQGMKVLSKACPKGQPIVTVMELVDLFGFNDEAEAMAFLRLFESGIEVVAVRGSGRPHGNR